ncbi:MAG: hypothetical protein ACI8TQ_000804 [Planctomycetota bacterium]|jgi:hypothetical protein
MNARLATTDSNLLGPELSLGQFRTVTRQVGRSKNGTNLNVRKHSKVNVKPRSTTNAKSKPKVNAKANGREAAGLGTRQRSSSTSRSASNGKPTYVNRDEPKLATKSGKVLHSARPTVSGSHGVHVTVKLQGGIPNLRQKHVIEALERCFSKAKDRFGFELTAYTVMSSRVGPGRYLPGPPTDPDVRNSRIRLLRTVVSLRAAKFRAHGIRRGQAVPFFEPVPPVPVLPRCAA